MPFKTSPSASQLIGRSRESRRLEELLDAVRSGQSQVLVVRGEAGIGKSALLDHLSKAAPDFTVLHASGVESEMELPFTALHQLCTSMLDRLAALPEPQREAATVAFGQTTGPAPDRLLIGLAVLNLLSDASEDGPLLCVIDDAQWLDRASAQALAFAARRLHAERVALVFATRGLDPILVGIPELVVEGLQPKDAYALLSAVLHVPVDERVRDRVVAETRGHPLALLEWARGSRPEKLAGGFGVPTTASMAGQVEDGFTRQILDLPPPTQRLLTIAAAEPTGDAALVWRAASIFGITPSDADPATAASLVDITELVSFRHPLVRSAAYGAAGLGERQATHRALAEATDPDRDPDRRAWHLALGSPGPDDDIADALEQSADRARARGGLGAAGALLERSVVLTMDQSIRNARTVAAAEAYLDAGSYDTAASLLASVDARHLDEVGQLKFDLARGRHASAGADIRESPALMLHAAKQLESFDPCIAAEVYLQALGAASMAGNYARGVTMVDVARAALACPRSKTPTVIEELTAALARESVEGMAAAAPALRSVVHSTTTDAVTSVPFYGFAFLGSAAALLWDRDGLHRVTAMHVGATRDIGALTMLPWALNTVVLLRTLDGDLEEAASVAAEANDIVQDTGGNLGLAWSHAILAAWRADPDALRLLDELAETSRATGNAQGLRNALWGRSILYNGLGEYKLALAASNEAMLDLADWGNHLFFHEGVEAAVRCGEHAVGSEILERLRDSTQPSGSDWAVGIQRRSEALLADGREAEELYGEAIERLSRTSLRPELARTHLLYGEWLRRENRRVDARAYLRSAHEIFTAIGSQAFAERARRELLATGETVRKRGPASSLALTPQESQIARLAADGQTNPEIGAQLFISARTVEWHLGKVFTKLEITSRRALRDALPRHDRLTAST
jgi:DNA-binding CsgD family transcriptional regulator